MTSAWLWSSKTFLMVKQPDRDRCRCSSAHQRGASANTVPLSRGACPLTVNSGHKSEVFGVCFELEAAAGLAEMHVWTAPSTQGFLTFGAAVGCGHVAGLGCMTTDGHTLAPNGQVPIAAVRTIKRPLVGLSRDYPEGFAAELHAHPQAQLLYAVSGVTRRAAALGPARTRPLARRTGAGRDRSRHRPAARVADAARPAPATG